MNEGNDLVESDFAQLVIARKLIKELTIENGILQSERDELRDELIKVKEETNNLSEDQIKQIKKDELLKGYKETINVLRKKISEYKKTNESLIMKNIQLQNQIK